MTGFLHRLAERATGAAQPLRRVASTVFAPSLVEETPQSVAAGMTARVNVTPSPIAQVAAKPVQPESSRAQSVNAKSVQRGESGMAETVDHAVMAYSQAMNEISGETLLGYAENQPPERLVSPASQAGQSAAAGAAFKPQSPSQAHSEMETEALESSHPAPAVSANFELLLPLAKPAQAALQPPANTNLAHPGRLTAGLVEETTEVHVSIGRIEVTAVHEPAPARPVASRRNAPMSLDDYLAKRHGGRP